MKVLVCGGRDYTDRDNVYKWLDRLFAPDYGHRRDAERDDAQPWWLPRPDLELILGGAKGVDSFAEDWAVVNWVKYKIYPADWEKLGKKAGILRNIQMLEEGKPDMVVVFPGGNGTSHMRFISTKAKVPVLEIYE